MTLLTVVRRMRPIDLLLPIGAALVSAGLQNLADREARSRARLDELAALAEDHREALAAAGVVAAGLLVDEQHPLDPGVPWLAAYAGDQEPPAGDVEWDKPRRRGWKLAVLGLAAVTTIAYAKRSEIAAALAARAGITYDDLAGEPFPDDHDAAAAPDGSTFNESSSAESAGEDVELAAVSEPGGPPAAGETATGLQRCGWPNCGWTSTPGKPVESQAIQAAVHRNRCTYRPAGAGVPGS